MVNNHPFVSTPNNGPCSSCGKERSDPIHTGIEKILICMRLANMHRVHPQQVEDRCRRCGEVIGIYPSGQLAMKMAAEAGDTIILECEVCSAAGGGVDGALLAPGALEEPFQSVSRNVDRHD